MDLIVDYLRANILGCIAIAISLTGAYYSMRQTLATEAQLRRKKPVVEVLSSTTAARVLRRPDPLASPNSIPLTGVFATVVIIRNIEPSCSLRLNAIVGTGCTKFVQENEVSIDDGYGNLILPDDVPPEILRKAARIDAILPPLTVHNSNSPYRGNEYRIVILSHQSLAASKIKLQWEWADGLKS